jgi:hypothetical protein
MNLLLSWSPAIESSLAENIFGDGNTPELDLVSPLLWACLKELLLQG